MDSSQTNTLWIFAWPLATAPHNASALFPQVVLQTDSRWQWGSVHGLQITPKRFTHTPVTFAGADATHKQALALATTELQQLQFQLLSNFVWEPGGDVFMRVFRHVQEPAYAAILLSLFGCFTEFESYFEGGATLTTSPLEDLPHQPEKQIFKYSHPDTLPADLWQAHLQHVKAFGQILKPTAATLKAFLAELDPLLKRVL